MPSINFYHRLACTSASKRTPFSELGREKKLKEFLGFGGNVPAFRDVPVFRCSIVPGYLPSANPSSADGVFRAGETKAGKDVCFRPACEQPPKWE